MNYVFAEALIMFFLFFFCARIWLTLVQVVVLNSLAPVKFEWNFWYLIF